MQMQQSCRKSRMAYIFYQKTFLIRSYVETRKDKSSGALYFDLAKSTNCVCCDELISSLLQKNNWYRFNKVRNGKTRITQMAYSAKQQQNMPWLIWYFLASFLTNQNLFCILLWALAEYKIAPYTCVCGSRI